LVSGAGGGVGSTYNVMGSRYLKLVAKVEAGEIRAAGTLQSECNAVIDELVRVGVFPGLKYMLYRQGVINTPVCRSPLATLSSASAGRLDEIATQLAG
jgi:N-acetylneuraminate lyase